MITLMMINYTNLSCGPIKREGWRWRAPYLYAVYEDEEGLLGFGEVCHAMPAITAREGQILFMF